METIKEYKTKNYIVTVKKDYEELSPYDCFDKTVYDVKNICQKIDQGFNQWLVLSVEIKKLCKCCNNYNEVKSSSLGGILIESDKDLFRDKYISQVMDMAKND